MDIWGPFSQPSLHGHSYFLTIVDDHTRMTWIYLLKFKSEVRSIIEIFVKMIETQFQVQVKEIRTDNGLEFQMTEFFNSKGIIHQRSCVYTPEQNAVVERKHQTLLNIADRKSVV